MNPLKPLLLWFKDRAARKAERERLARFAEMERQTAYAASELARHGAAKRRRDAKARQDETTARLRMEIAAGYVAKLRERVHG